MIRSKIVLLKSTQWLDEESNNNYFEVYFVGFLLEWLKREKERKNNKDLEEDEDLSKKEKEMYRSEAQRIFTFEYALRLIKRTCPPFSHRFSKYVLKAWFNRALFSEREREKEGAFRAFMAQPSQKLPSFQTPPLSDGKMLERRGRASIRIISMPFNSFSFSNGKAVTPIFQFQSFSLSLRVHIYILPKKKKKKSFSVKEIYPEFYYPSKNHLLEI